MTSSEFIDSLTEYFSGSYSPKVLERMRFFAGIIPEAELESVYELIEQDNRSTYKISVKEIKDACNKLGVSYYDPVERQYRMVVCDACEWEYKYFPCPTDEEKLNAQMFDRCPRCGFDYDFQRRYLQYEKSGNVQPKYATEYARRRDECLKNHGEGKEWVYNASAMRAYIRDDEAAKVSEKRRKFEEVLKRKTFYSTRGVEKMELQREIV